MRQINLIIDLQFGSTGKGLIAGYLARRTRPDTVITAWAANAGHTYIDERGCKFVHTMLANGIVSPGIERLMIGPGSILDMDNLFSEIDGAVALGAYIPPIFIHENAAIIQQRHRDEEAGPMTKIGSTKKGVGAAAIQRIRRNPDDMNTVGAVWGRGRHAPMITTGAKLDLHVVSPQEYAAELNKARVIQIEGAQGHSLSMYSGFYPYTTSRDVSTHQILADCAIPAGVWARTRVIGTARTYPIRVANRYNEQGEQVGWSGPAYPDQVETTFEGIGKEVELTTVTKLPRRIFTFSKQQVVEGIRHNGVSSVFLNFANYCQSPEELTGIIAAIESTGAAVSWLGWGPRDEDISPRRGGMFGMME